MFFSAAALALAQESAQSPAVSGEKAPEDQLKMQTKKIGLVIHGGADPCNDPSTSERKEAFFTGDYQRVVLDGVGHFPQREAPRAVAEAIIRHLGKAAGVLTA